MRRFRIPLLAFALFMVLPGRERARPGLHRALREPDYGRVLGVSLSDLHRAGLDRERHGCAGHAQPVLARSASAARPFPASGSRSGCGSRRGSWT